MSNNTPTTMSGNGMMPAGCNGFELQHQVSSSFHRAGECQSVVKDYIILGRSQNCDVRFDDKYSVVSREHAAIKRDGDGWVLIQLSKTNSTLLNGHPINDKWFLQDGDEIQLAVNGPKLKFKVPAQQSVVNSRGYADISPVGNAEPAKVVGLTQRFIDFKNKDLKRYRIGISCAISAAVIAIGIGLYNYFENGRINEWVAHVEAQIADANSKIGQLSTNLNDLDGRLSGFMKEIDGRLTTIDEAVAKAQKTANAAAQKAKSAADAAARSGSASSAAIQSWDKSVYYMQCAYISVSDGEITQNYEISYSGTGFMLDDNRFVTARHVAEPWVFNTNPGDADMRQLSVYKEAGLHVTAHFVAYSPSGDNIQLSSDEFISNRSKDVITDMGEGMRIRTCPLGSTDWSTAIVKNRTGLPKDAARSNSLKRGETVQITGFPYGLGAESANNINAIHATAKVAQDGLNGDGVILVTDNGSEHGNSGGPVLIDAGKDKYVVIGLVSAGAGNNLGFFVPISAIDKH